jgi:hypothetical protein
VLTLLFANDLPHRLSEMAIGVVTYLRWGLFTPFSQPMYLGSAFFLI